MGLPHHERHVPAMRQDNEEERESKIRRMLSRVLRTCDTAYKYAGNCKTKRL